MPFHDVFDTTPAAPPAPNAPAAPSGFVDVLDPSQAPTPTLTALKPGPVTAFLKSQLGGNNEQDYGSGAGYLIDNPVTRGLGSGANSLGTGLSEVAQHAAALVSPTAANYIQKNITQPLAARQSYFEAPKNAGLGSDVVQGVSNLAGQLAFAGLTGGAGAEAEAATVAPGIVAKVASHMTPAALRAAGLLGFGAAGAKAAQEEAQTGEPVSNLSLVGHGLADTAANLVPLGGKGGVLRRALTGAVVGEGVNEAQNAVDGQPLGTGAVMATGLGAGLGLIPHAKPGSLKDVRDTINPPDDAATTDAGGNTNAISLAPSVLLKQAAQSLAYLRAKRDGTPDVQTVTPEGVPVTVRGKPQQFMTDSEKEQLKFLEENGTDPQALAKRRGVNLLPKTEDIPLKSAAPGSLTDVANDAGGGEPPNPPGGGTPAATPPADNTPPAPIHVALPWVDQATGEVSPPTKDQLTSALTDYITQTYDQQGHMRYDVNAVADAWGVPADQLKKVRNKATNQANADIRARPADGAAVASAETPAADATTTPGQPSGDSGQLPDTAASPADTVASVPFMKTNAMRDELRALGHSDADIAAMTPADAHAILKAGERVLAPARDLLGTTKPAADEAVKQAQDALDAKAADEAAAAKTQATAKEPADATPQAAQAEGGEQPVSGADVPAEAGTDVPAAESEASSRAPAKAPEEKAAASRADVPAEQPAKVADTSTKETALPEPDANGLITTKTVYGDTVRVRATDLAGDRPSLMMRQKDGTPVKGSNRLILRDNLDLTGEKSSARAAEDAKNPLFQYVTKNDGGNFASAAAAQREVNRLGFQDTHDVVPASEVQPGKKGFVGRRKPAAEAAKAEESKPATPFKPLPGARDAEALRVKTADGETNGRSHVDQLIKDGYTKVANTQAGDKMVHSMVNEAGEHQPIKARQLRYAKAASEKAGADVPKPEPTAAQVQQERDANVVSKELGDRAEKLQPRIDALTDEQARAGLEAIGETKPKDLHDPKTTLARQHPDDIETALKAAEGSAGIQAEAGDAERPAVPETGAGEQQGLKGGDTTKPATAASDVNQSLTSELDAPATIKEPLKVAAKTATAPIDDFGETLHGARKHYAEEYAARVNDGLKLDLATEPLSKTWPEPDYAKAIEAGTAPEVASWVHAARDEIPNRPVKGWKKRGWVEAVTVLRQLSTDLMSGKIGYDELQQKLAQPEYKGLREKIGGRAELYAAVGHDVSLKGVTMGEHHYTLYKGEKNVTKWSVEKPGKKGAFGNWPAELGVGNTKAEAIAAFKNNLKALEAKPKVSKPAPLIVYSRRGVNKFFIGVKVRGDAIDLHSADTAKEAREYLSAHREELVARVAKMKEVPSERNASNAPRIGIDHRAGADVTPEHFGDTFGFRGVQFGNYVEGPRRQADLNNAYDALMDMAGVLDVPPKALSLNGTLGLAFGARGHGGKGAAAAHYEPDKIVINLTKAAGAGSLAHEWWHSLDNYFSMLRKGSDKTSRGNNYLTEQAKGQPIDGVREEMAKAFQRVANTINETGLRERSKNLDKLKTKDYWSTGREMSARSFENYMIAKLADQGAANDYLANIVSEATFGTDHAYPYLKAGEIPAVRAAYDDFFHTVQTKESSDGKVALFSQDDPASKEPFHSALTRSVDTAKGAPKAGDATAWTQWMDGAQRRGEFKQAEREWLGVDQWLADQKGKVTREQLQQFVRDNQVQVQETTLGKSNLASRLKARRFDDLSPEEQKAVPGADFYEPKEWVVSDGSTVIGSHPANDSAEVAVESVARVMRDEGEADSNTKFSSYQLPGGKNYRELLLTLPDGKDGRRAELERQISDLTDKRAATNNLAEDERLLDEIRPLYKELNSGPTGFKSGHFDQPNILAHVRFNERTDADGKKVLFLEEVQSDWHQAGRKAGYFDASKPWEVYNPKDGKPVARFTTEAEAKSDAEKRGPEFDYSPSDHGRDRNAVPDAPLKKEWPMLAMKRMVRYAAENGFDRVAWTTGEQQAARYDLSKQIDSVFAVKSGAGYELTVEGKGGETLMDTGGSPINADKLADTVGKELAQKIEDEAGDNPKGKSYAGLDLKVGGEGMKAFYDKMLPNEVNKWAKPFGGKVGEAKLPSIYEARVSNKGTWYVVDTAAKSADMSRSGVAGPFATKEEAQAKLDELGGADVHSLDITPDMRKAALGGLPLFRQDAGGTHADAGAEVTPAQQAHTARIDQIVKAAMGKWKGDDVPSPRVVDTPEQLPPRAKLGDDGRPSNAYKNAAGMYDGKTIWVVASKHSNDAAGMRKLLTTIAHEGVGHYGVNRIVERELGANAWDKIQTSTERLRADPSKASASIRSVIDSVERRYPGASPQLFAEEFLAVSAERGVKNALLDRGITAVRQWLRKVMPDLHLSARELRQLLVKSDEYLRVGETQPQRVMSRAAMAFSQEVKAFKQQVRDTLASGNRRGGMLDMGRVAAVFRMMGLRDLPMRMPPDVLFKLATGKDGQRPALTESQIARLPEKLDEPVAVLRSKTQAGSYVVLTDMKDGKGQPVIVSIKPDGRDARVDVHVLTSSYGKGRDEWAAGQQPIYLDKEKAQGLLGSDAALFREVEPKGQGPADKILTPEDLRKFRSDESARTLGENQRAFSQADQTDTPEFKRFFGNSEVVNAKGDPLPVYHGTADDFEAFDPNRSGSATAHMTATLGSFFAESRSKAQHYAENASQGVPAEERVIDAYLSIQKPYEMGLKEFMGIDSQAEATALREKLKAEGYDGIHLKDVGQWVAFDPTQIKSASENRGTFDRTDSRINFSRDDENADPDHPEKNSKRKPFTDAAQSIEAIHDTLPTIDRTAYQKVKDWIAGKARDLEPLALGAIQLRHVLELAAEDPTLKDPARHYAATYQRMDGERNTLAQEGSAKVDALARWSRQPGPAGWLGKVRPEAVKLYKFMHAVTQLAVDPTNQYEKLLMRDDRNEFKPWTKELIKKRVKILRETALTRSGDDKTRLFDEIKQLRALPAREKVREQKYPELVRAWNALTPEAQEHFKVMREHYREQSEALEEATQARIASLDIPESQRRVAEALVHRNFEDAKVDGVYFPLSRFGDYWISATTKDGEYVFAKYEGADQMQQAEKRFIAAGAHIEARGRQDGNFQAKNAPSGTFIGELMGVLKNSPDKVKDEIYQMYLKTLPEMSLRKSGIHRKNIAGYTDDVPRAFASSVFHGAHQLSKAKYGWQLANTLDQLRERMEDRRTVIDSHQAAHADALLGELARRHDWIMNPSNSKLANKLTSIGFAYYLAASPASAIVNLLQVPQIVLPVLGAHHGWGAAGSVLTRTMRDAIRTGGNIDKVLTGEDLRAFQALRDDGTFQRTAVHSLAGISEGDQLRSSPAYTKVMNAVSYMFHTSEVINREGTGIAAFRLARQKGQTFQQAVRYAEEITNGTHGDYSNANRARYMQGNVSKVALQFKNYSLAMSWLWGRNFYKAFKGESPEVRAIARKTLTGMLGMTGLFAGFLGMPISNVLKYGAQAVHTATSDDDTPWDFDTEFRSWLAEHLGQTAADVIADGPASQLGANVASRVSMSDLWFRDADRQLEGEAAYNNLLQSLAGPLGGMIKNMYVGAQQFNQGHTERGIETMLPTFAKNAVKSMRYASQGVNTLRGDPIVKDVGAAGDVIQALGFQPTKVAQQQRVNNALYTYQQFIQDRRQALMNAFAMAQAAGDMEGRNETQQKIRAFNQKYPEIAIGMANLHASLRSRAKFSAQADNGIRLNQKLAGRLREAVGVTAAQ